MNTVRNATEDEEGCEGCLHRGQIGRGSILANHPGLKVTWWGGAKYKVKCGVGEASSVI
jgi:hypothetical protein